MPGDVAKYTCMVLQVDKQIIGVSHSFQNQEKEACLIEVSGKPVGVKKKRHAW